MRFLWFLLTLSGLVSQTLAANEHDYLPLVDGQEWIMDAKMTLPEGKTLTGTTRRVLGPKEERNGKTYICQRTWTDGELAMREMTKWLRLDSEGIHSLDPLEPKHAEQTEAGLPLVVGKTWTMLIGDEEFTHTVIALEEVTIGEKIYKECFHIRSVSKRGILTEDYWEAPKVGCIKSVATLSDGRTITATLREFKPGTK